MSSQQAPLWATCAAVAAASGLIGYFVGVGATLPISRSIARGIEANTAAESEDEGSEGDSESELGDDELANVKAEGSEPCKLVLVVRTDLKMNKGKIAAQCGHATLACYKALTKSNPTLVRHWERTGQAKIAVQCDSEDDLLLLQATAKSLGLCARSIQDAGRTQVAAGSTTVLGIGPAPVRIINQVTSHLKLL
ncbi:peptidyl-tRNA hydrolase, PTH2 family, partial [Phenoliferia sp. Uapishka_3]